MANTVPYEIIAAPFTLWVAPVGTAFPAVDDAPTDPWVKIGTSGNLNYDSDTGVVVSHPQSINKFRGLGDSGPRKVFRGEEDLIIRIALADVTPEQYAQAINGNAVTDTPPGSGTAGTRKLGLSRGFTVNTVALLVRGDASPYGATGVMQYEVPIAAQVGNPEVVYRKDQAALLQLEWHALVDPNAASVDERFGRLVAQDAEAFS